VIAAQAVLRQAHRPTSQAAGPRSSRRPDTRSATVMLARGWQVLRSELGLVGACVGRPSARPWPRWRVRRPPHGWDAGGRSVAGNVESGRLAASSLARRGGPLLAARSQAGWPRHLWRAAKRARGLATRRQAGWGSAGRLCLGRQVRAPRGPWPRLRVRRPFFGKRRVDAHAAQAAGSRVLPARRRMAGTRGRSVAGHAAPSRVGVGRALVSRQAGPCSAGTLASSARAPAVLRQAPGRRPTRRKPRVRVLSARRRIALNRF
jgi:hypothetical protein